MKFKYPVTLNLLSPKSRYKSEDFLSAIRTYCECLPMILPSKWGWWEPLTRTFNPQELDEMVHENGACETIFWKRTAKPKAEGSFDIRWHSKSPIVQDTHSDTQFTYELGQVSQTELVSWLKKASLIDCAHFAMMDVLTPVRREFGIEGQYVRYGDIMITTHLLRHWLPDVFWGMVMGPPYIKLFGLDNLLSAPVWKAEKISEDMVYMQLTEKLSDAVDDPVVFQERQDAVKKHLKIDAFFQTGRGYNRQKRGPVGDIFAVPKFDLDGYDETTSENMKLH